MPPPPHTLKAGDPPPSAPSRLETPTLSSSKFMSAPKTEMQNMRDTMFLCRLNLRGVGRCKP